jgi:hypothetical protein
VVVFFHSISTVVEIAGVGFFAFFGCGAYLLTLSDEGQLAYNEDLTE